MVNPEWPSFVTVQTTDGKPRGTTVQRNRNGDAAAGNPFRNPSGCGLLRGRMRTQGTASFPAPPNSHRRARGGSRNCAEVHGRVSSRGLPTGWTRRTCRAPARMPCPCAWPTARPRGERPRSGPSKGPGQRPHVGSSALLPAPTGAVLSVLSVIGLVGPERLPLLKGVRGYPARQIRANSLLRQASPRLPGQGAGLRMSRFVSPCFSPCPQCSPCLTRSWVPAGCRPC